MSDFDPTEEFLRRHPAVQPGQSFAFACHPGVACFNACCSNLRLNLTPFDVLRLRRALGLSSRDFISRQACMLVAPDTGFPLLQLKMNEDDAKSCPYVTPQGCSVYGDRPTACRSYPLGRACNPDAAGATAERFFIIREPHCQGFEETRDWTPLTWLDDQGLADYNASNDAWMALMARQRALGHPVDQKRTSMALLALYQPDDFQTFIGRMNLFARVSVAPERQQAVLADETAALAFGLDWLELLLFGDSSRLTPNQ